MINQHEFSVNERAHLVELLFAQKNGLPVRSMVLGASLENSRLVSRENGHYKLTAAGRVTAMAVAENKAQHVEARGVAV